MITPCTDRSLNPLSPSPTASRSFLLRLRFTSSSTNRRSRLLFASVQASLHLRRRLNYQSPSRRIRPQRDTTGERALEKGSPGLLSLSNDDLLLVDSIDSEPWHNFPRLYSLAFPFDPDSFSGEDRRRSLAFLYIAK